MIVANPPKVQIHGRPPQGRGELPYENGVTTYPTKRLSARMGADLAGLLAASARVAEMDLRDINLAQFIGGNITDTERAVQLFQGIGRLTVAALEADHTRDDLFKFCANLIGVPVEVFDDGEVMPFDAPYTILLSIREQPDLQRFIEYVGKMLGGMGQTSKEPASASPESSTPSASAMDGQTTPS